MFLRRTCPRCKGSLRESWDNYGSFYNCLQCGYYHDTGAIAEGEADEDSHVVESPTQEFIEVKSKVTKLDTR